MVTKNIIVDGKRMIGWLMEDSPYTKLRSNIDRHMNPPTARQNAPVKPQVKTIRYTPYPGNSTLRAEASVTSSESQNHQVSIQFSKVTFELSDSPTNITYITSVGSEQSMAPIRLNNTMVKVRCTCLDFKFRFATWNFNDNSLIGDNPPPYIRKTVNRPEVNPKKVPGVCKHVISVVANMKKQGMII